MVIKAKKKTANKKVTKKNVTKSKSDKSKKPVIASRHIIPAAQGLQMTKKFMLLKKANKLTDIKFSVGREFDVSLFEALLSLPSVVKLRFKNAVNDAGEHTLVVTGVDANMFDVYLPTSTPQSSGVNLPLKADDGGGAGDMGDQCSDPKYKP